MVFALATLAALFLLFASASSAPAGLNEHDRCAKVKNSSLELNRIAKAVAAEARNGSKDVIHISTSLVWMEAKDMCDPGTLKQDSAACIGKILDVLRSYNSALEMIAQIQSCSQFVRKVKPAMEKLHTDMSTCVQSRGGKHHKTASHLGNEGPPQINRWQEALLCHYTMDRLFSFSIFTARVFARGDPANHTEGAAQKCM